MYTRVCTKIITTLIMISSTMSWVIFVALEHAPAIFYFRFRISMTFDPARSAACNLHAMDDWNEDVEFAKVAEAGERYEDMAKVSECTAL